MICPTDDGTTSCSWDSVIPFVPLWYQYNRIIKGNGAIVLFAAQPFTSALIMSNYNMFKYCWYWDKCNVGGFVNAHIRPLKVYEDICVFSKGTTCNGNDDNMPYYPQGLKIYNKMSSSSNSKSPTGFYRENCEKKYLQEYTNYPKQTLTFELDDDRFHPTQKPVALCEYLIKTYTNENDLVMDNCMGSGTTGVACVRNKRKFIGIEKDPIYFNKAQQRINETEVIEENMWF